MYAYISSVVFITRYGHVIFANVYVDIDHENDFICDLEFDHDLVLQLSIGVTPITYMFHN